MKTSAIISSAAAAFMVATTAIAYESAPKEPLLTEPDGVSSETAETLLPRYSILDHSGWKDFSIRDVAVDETIQSLQKARSEHPDSFDRRGGFSFYYTHIRDNHTDNDILCSGVLTISPTRQGDDLYPEIFTPDLYTTSPTVQHLLVSGDYIDENLTQYGSCMTVDSDDQLGNKDFYILRPLRAFGIHAPTLMGEADDFTYMTKDEYEDRLWEDNGWEEELDEAWSLFEQEQITAEQYRQIDDDIFHQQLNGMLHYFNQNAYGTHKNAATCPNAGYMLQTILDISGGRHDGGDLPLCGTISLDALEGPR